MNSPIAPKPSVRSMDERRVDARQQGPKQMLLGAVQTTNAKLQGGNDAERVALSSVSSVTFSPEALRLHALNTNHDLTGSKESMSRSEPDLPPASKAIESVFDAISVATDATADVAAAGVRGAAGAIIDGINLASSGLHAAAHQIDRTIGEAAVQIGDQTATALGYGVLSALVGASAIGAVI